MAKFKAPGVYIEEAPIFPSAIIEAESGIPIFIGYTQKAISNGASVAYKPFRISSFKDYSTVFGTIYPAPKTSRFPGLGKNSTLVQKTVLKVPPFTIPVFKMDAALQLYFLNGGGPCYIFSCGETGHGNQPAKAVFADALNELDAHFEGDILLMPDALSLATGEYYELMNLAMEKAAASRKRFVIADVHEPGVNTGKTLQDAVSAFRSAINPQNGAFGAVYYPWLKTTMADTGGIGSLVLPPSPAIAAVYAKTERDLGIWKAPANMSLTGITQPVFNITDFEQDDLNVDVVAGLSVNAIRPFTGKGILVWGARTLAGNDHSWRYVPVKRLFIWVEKSITQGLHRTVFEPNNQQTWTKAKAGVENFLINLWRQGALQGAKPQHAFYVKAGLNETMTQNDLDNGRMVVEIGMAPVKPAEFIIIRIAFSLQPN